MTPFIRNAAGLMLLAPAVALAHPGHVDAAIDSAFHLGWLHPLTGIDHLAAMLAVGCWSALTASSAGARLGRAGWFAGFLLIGALTGWAGLALPAVEPMIMVSLLVIGLILARADTQNAALPLGLMAFFALFHGVAHVAEVPSSMSPVQFTAGFMTASLLLLGLGAGLGALLTAHRRWLQPVLGATVAGYGMVLLGLARG